MGLFGDLKMMGGIMKDVVNIGISSFKACDQMEKLIEEARGHLTDVGFLTPMNINAIKEYDMAKKANANKSDTLSNEESLKLSEAEEQKQVACMKSFQTNPKFSAEFRTACGEAVKLYQESCNDDKLFDTIEDRMLQSYNFKPEEEEIVRKMFDMAQDNVKACDKMIAQIDTARASALSNEADRSAIAAYDAAKAAYEKANSKKVKDMTPYVEAQEQAEVACMAAFQKNLKYNPKFRIDCKTAAKAYADTEAAVQNLKNYEK